MRIGAKTMTALTLLVASALATGANGRLRADYLAQLDVWASFAVGAFAVLTASAVFHFGRLGQPSEHHLFLSASHPRVERADPFERTPQSKPRWWRTSRGVLMRGTYFVVFLQVGLLTIDNRGVALLASLPGVFQPSRHAYCLEDEAPEPDPPRLAGCTLLRRAYALGYATDLGPCAPEEAEAVDEVCRRRQLDEPYLHYAWRLLAARRSALVPDAADGIGAAVANVRDQWEHLGALLLSRRDSVAQTPRSSHHLFTNLPPPRAGVGGLIDRLHAAACDQRTARMPPLLEVRTDAHAPSLIVEHAMGHLLFNPSYPTVVAACREHTIHWNAPRDACERLRDAPKAFLQGQGALDEVEAVVARHQRATLAWRLATERGETLVPPPPPPIVQIVSFQCLMVEPARSEPTVAKVIEASAVIDGHAFGVREVEMASLEGEVRAQIRVFLVLSRLLAPGFRYGSLQSEQSLVDADAGRAAARRFANTRDLLSKLELLRETDIFVGHEWIYERPDLLAVYPYPVHLSNFVEAFRRHYQHTRARL